MSEFVRLSQSGLWEKQRAYYSEQGVKAWTTGTVPHYVTNNPQIATAYVDLITAHLQDLLLAEQLNPEQPVFIVELGGGSGRLAYLILRRLEELREELPAQLVYVLTDFTKANLKHWRGHERFLPFFDEKTLDVALFDAEKDETITTTYSKYKLDGSGNPVFFIANYLFDTLPMDCFRCHQGTLEEGLVQLQESDNGPSLSFHYETAGSEPYGREEFDSILRAYQDRLGATHVLFPVAPLACLENLSRVSGGQMCLIAADKAWARWEDLVGVTEPEPIAHGPSFSFTVNFHAMAEFWRKFGGVSFHTSPRDSMLGISLFCSGLERSELTRTSRAFTDRVDRFGPLDFFNLKQAILTSVSDKNLRLCLELMRMAHWDPDILYDVAEPLCASLDGAITLHKRELFLALARTWKNYFPIGESRDVPFELARVLFRMEYFEQALHFYEESLRLCGKHKMTYFNMGLCEYYLRRLEAARDCFEQALEMDPDYGIAREWLVRLEPEINESGAFPILSGVTTKASPKQIKKKAEKSAKKSKKRRVKRKRT